MSGDGYTAMLTSLSVVSLGGSVIWTVLAAGVTIALLAHAARRVRGTTLLAPVVWAIVSIAVVAGVEMFFALAPVADAIAQRLRYLVAISSVCPGMALLGAKRPQNRAWQWIVGSLWGVLALPAGHAAMISRTSTMRLDGIWSVFLLILIAVHGINYLPTRFWRPAILSTAGQLVLLSPFVVSMAHGARQWGLLVPPLGITLFLAALAMASVTGSRARHDFRDALDPLWLGFRDRYGLVWGWRVAERINGAARLAGWNVRLRWNGFEPPGFGEPKVRHDVATMLRSTLTRFVSREWIENRLGPGGCGRPSVGR